MQAASNVDVLVVGGGLAGSSLAITLAREGMDVLVVERDRVFRDRVRGEAMATWGTVQPNWAMRGLMNTLNAYNNKPQAVLPKRPPSNGIQRGNVVCV